MPPEVKVRLSVEGTPEALAAFRSVQAQAQASGRASGKAFAPLAGALSGIKGLLAGAAAAFSVGALVSFGKEVIDNVESIGRLAVGLGTTVEHLSGLSVAATLADSDLETVSGSMGKLAKSVDDLRNGSPTATAAFARLGLTAKDFPGEDTARWYETVATRLSKLADGGAKTAVTMALMGKNARMSLPAMKQLIDLGGLQGAEAKARSMGLMVDAETLTRVAALADAMKILKMETTGVALQFVRGFAPEAVAGLNAMTGSTADLNTTMTTLGGLIGGLWRPFLPLIGAIDILANLVAKIAVGITGLLQAGAMAATGNFSGAKESLGLLQDELTIMNAKARFRAEQREKAFYGKTPDLPGVKTPDGRDRVQDEKDAAAAARADAAASARRARQKQAIEDELKLKLDGYKIDEDDAKRAYDGYLMGLDDYFARRRELVEQRLAAEIAALDKQRALADQEKDPTKRGAEQDRISTAASSLALEAKAQLKVIASEEEKASDESLQASLNALKKILEARGEVHRARMIEISQEAQVERDRLTRAGVKGPELESGVDKFRANQVALADFEEQARQVQAAIDALQNSADVTPEQIQRLRDVAAALEKAAAAFGPEAVAKIRAATDALDEMSAKGDQLKPWAQTLESTLGSWLGSTINQVNSLSDAFRSLALAILQAVQQMLAAAIAKQILGWMPGAKASPTAKARGGLIQGPGTSMSDSIFALLSNGEYVVRAFAVAQPGVLAHLEAINRGVVPRPTAPVDTYRSMAIRQFSEGGLANARPMASASSGGVNLAGGATIELSEGLIARHVDTYLQSSEGQRTQIRVISKNRRAIGSALR